MIGKQGMLTNIHKYSGSDSIIIGDGASIPITVTSSNPDWGEAKENREGVVAGQPRTTQSGQYLVSDRRTSRGKPGIDQCRRIPEVDVTIKRRLFIVTSTSGIRLHWSMTGLPREVRRSLTRYCPLWVVRGCPATTPSRFCFASPKSGFEPCCLQFSMLPLEIIGEKMDPESLYEAGNFILSFQSENGGLAVWERAGASLPLEWLNPVEFLDDLVAFVLFKKLYPNHKKKEVENFITEAVKYIEEEQTADGSWYGNWGICFLYGTAFALGGLAAAGKTYNNCLAIRRAVEFLLNSQSDDDGWGESFLSCPNKIYTPLEGKRSNSVQTALAEITGVFLRNCVLHYPDCRNIFPLWALAECLSRVPLPSYIAYNNSNREYIE
ncbi:hypothetical protein ACOSQ2_021766 [Xanthoceras sorbifolium]